MIMLDNANVSNAIVNLTSLADKIYGFSSTGTTYNGGSMSFSPGVYNLAANPGGTLTFNANGDANAQFFLISYASITFENGITFNLTGNAQANNIFWLAYTGAITFSSAPSIIDGVFIAGTSINFTNPTDYTIYGNILAKAAVTFGGTGSATINTNIVCYLKGTKILTENGYVEIEKLNVGDRVVSKGKIRNNKYIDSENHFSLEPIIWIGNFKVLNLTSKSLPICIQADAFGKNNPFENLYVSPAHRILIEGKMVMAKKLVNGKTIFQDTNHNPVEYYHLELESHSSILANGVLSESYLVFNNNRYSFQMSKKNVPLQITHHFLIT